MPAKTRSRADTLFRAIPRLLAIALGAGSLALAYIIAARNARFFHDNPAELSDLGSFFSGTVAPLLNLAVFAMLLLAFLEQRRQVDLQEHELGESRKHAENSAFESTFYRVLEILRRVAESVEMHPAGPDSPPVRGVAAFREAVALITTKLLADRAGGQLDLDLAIDRAVLESCFTDESDFGHYFRTLSYLLKHLEQSGGSDAASLAQLIAAQMGRYEAELVFAVGATSRGQELRPHLERYRMFEEAHIRKELIVLRHFYTADAFTL
jgi:hypothetical protein